MHKMHFSDFRTTSICVWHIILYGENGINVLRFVDELKLALKQCCVHYIRCVLLCLWYEVSCVLVCVINVRCVIGCMWYECMECMVCFIVV